MTTRLKTTLLFSFLCLSLQAEEFDAQLKNPKFSQGTISSSEGGVIKGQNLRIQADHISYTHKIEKGHQIKKVSAHGNLLLEYQGHIFVGEELTYDLILKTGIMKNGRTCTDYWFIGGKEIELLPDGSFWIAEAYLTTVESQDPWWQIRSSNINVSKAALLSAKNVKLRFFDFPVFWLPSFKMNLKFLKDIPIRYKFIWNQVLKQKVSVRYELYSTETFSLFGRLDYRFRKGPGAAIETNYLSTDKRTLFQTKSYGAYDKIVPDERGNKRFRLQGLATYSSIDDKTRLHLSYDKLRDDKMPQDFKGDEFEVNTQKRTIAWLSHQTDFTISEFTLQPRINSFQSINQQLPLISIGIRPFPLNTPWGNSGIISDNRFSMGYLNYVYARGLADELKSSRAARLEARNTLYRRFSFGGISWTPWVGFYGLFYSNSPKHHAASQFIGLYGFRAHAVLARTSPNYLHKIEPYLELRGSTHPTTSPSRHFIFSIEDGVARETIFRPGVMQLLYSSHTSFLPNITWDLYTNVFLGETSFHRALPKLYTTCDFSYSSWRISTDLIYNLQETVLDRASIRSAWTLSEDAAFTLEFRHRSRFDWRKSDQNNFVVDIIRPIGELLHSPLSDGRNTLLSNFQFRFAPLWTCHFQSHHGWGRKNEPRYDAYEVKIATLLSGRWQIEFGYKFSPSTREWIFPSFKLLNTSF